MNTLNSKILYINSKLEQLETLRSHVAYMESELAGISSKMKEVASEISNIEVNAEIEKRNTILGNVFSTFSNKSIDVDNSELLLSKFKEIKSLEGEYKIIQDQLKKTKDKLSEILDYKSQLSSLLNQKEYTIRNQHSEEATTIIFISERMMHMRSKISYYKIEMKNLIKTITHINKSMYLIHNIITSGKMEYFGTFDDCCFLKKKIIEDLSNIRNQVIKEHHDPKIQDPVSVEVTAKIKSYFDQLNIFCENFIKMEVNDFKIRRNLEDLKMEGNSLNQEVKAFEKYINTELERLKSGIEDCTIEKQNTILSVVILEESLDKNKQ